jgi:carbamoyltransferase
VEDVFVFPHMGDGGLALGAAWAAAGSDGIAGSFDSLALGPAFGSEEAGDALRQAGLAASRPDNLVRDVAERIVAGQVVCWFQGRMEYGPRALGYRSVLARPDRPDLRDRLNLILKRRVWYQPFCPSVLAEEAPRLFSDWTPAGRTNRAMTMAYLVHPDYRQAMSGVTSIDGSCRPQLVAESGTEPLAPVLRHMRRLIGVGAILNTSFNIHSEPLVCSPAEAIDVFQRCGADALAIGPYVAERPGLAPERQRRHAVGAAT